MNRKNVLLLDIDTATGPSPGLGGSLRGILEKNPQQPLNLRHESVAAGDVSVWKELMASFKPCVVFLVSPCQALRQVRSLFASHFGNRPETPVVVVSDAGEPDEMFEFIRLGAADFFTPPLRSIEVLPRFWRLLERVPLGGSIAGRIRSGVESVRTLIGSSPSFIEQANRIPAVARCDANVLILGETGTGKELFARAIHDLSPRAGAAFIPINCGAIPIELIENELFGHERGAYTGAMAASAGLIAEADGGTLFLDEIDSLPLLAQVKLLRFLQDKEFRSLGSSRLRHADVRIVTATNIDIEKAVREGRLRMDLYYRLNIVPLRLPPLRERVEDIPLLARHFLEVYARKFDKQVEGISNEALRKLVLYNWPGNVRELEHTIERAVALSHGKIIEPPDIDLRQMPDGIETQSLREAKARVVAQFEHTYLLGLMLACEGNITRAAEMAGKNRRAFWELLRKYRIDAGSVRDSKRAGR